MNKTSTRTWRWGRKRWLALALIGLGVYFGFMGPTLLQPIAPAVSLPGEYVGLNILGFKVTNTILGFLVAEVVLVLAAIAVRRKVKSGGALKPSGWYNFVEWIIEFLWNTTEGIAGPQWAGRIFPWMATIFCLVLVANLTKLIPGHEAFGLLEAAKVGQKGYTPVLLLGNIYALDKGTQPKVVEATAAGAGEAQAAEETHPCEVDNPEALCMVAPFFRGAATDLNFTLALSLITMFIVQLFGLWALKLGHLSKFFNLPALVSGDILKTVDFGVGLLELISEIGKVLSFAFRLFGNIFAGALLLSLVGSMTVVVVPAGLMLFELFVGVLQAYIFALLATVFMSQATHGHAAAEAH